MADRGWHEGGSLKALFDGGAPLAVAPGERGCVRVEGLRSKVPVACKVKGERQIRDEGGQAGTRRGQPPLLPPRKLVTDAMMAPSFAWLDALPPAPWLRDDAWKARISPFAAGVN